MSTSRPPQPARARLIRTSLAALIVMTCLRVWLGPVTLLESAQAQIPDSGLQRKQILDEARRANELLAEISASLSRMNKLLTTGTLNVRLAGADKKTGAATMPRTPNP